MAKSRTASPKSPAAELSVQAQTTFDFLGDASRYLYIPAYQRPFAWKAKGDISRFFNDVIDGIHEMTGGDHDDASAFLGALILVNDVTREQIHPAVKAQVPAGVHIVIDGQQRCTTIAVWVCALLTAIGDTRTLLEKDLGSEGEDAASGWSDLLTHIDSFHTQLASMIRNKKTESKTSPQYTYYPKLIRSHEDLWSVKAREAKYVSPIGRLLWSMSCWLLTDRRKRFKYKLDELDFDGFRIPEVPSSERISHKEVVDAFKKLLDWCTNYATNPTAESAPDLPRLWESKQVQMVALGAELDETIVKILKAKRDELDKRQLLGHQVIRLALLASYLMNRVCVTVVTTERDDRAFDMFDALNTTGQPLTAFETFKPIVIEHVGLAHYRDSDEFKLIQEIDELFKEGDKNKQTEKFVIHAALLERGRKESKRLAKQRDWLKSHFTRLGKQREQIKTLQNLASLARLEMNFAGLGERTLPTISPDAQLAFEILRETKHDITLPLLARFQKQYDFAATSQERGEAAADFGKACKIVAAFATLWRLANGGTAQIDDKFRLLMQGGTLALGGAQGAPVFQIGPYCNFPESSAALSPDISRLSKEVKSLLQHGGTASQHADLADATIWTAKTSGRASYLEERRFLRFFLATAMHDSIPSVAEIGLLERGNSGTNDMLGIHAKWFEEKHSIEHVAPQSRRDWPQDIYEPDDTLQHCIGNLTLLRPDINSAIKDRTWKVKRAAFSLMIEQQSSAQRGKYEQFISQYKIKDFPKLEQIAVEGKYHPHLTAAAKVEDWTADLIRKRSANLCKLGHEQLMRWIESP